MGWKVIEIRKSKFDSIPFMITTDIAKHFLKVI